MKTVSHALRHAAQATIEHLEHRRLLSALLNHGLWIIRGDANPANRDDRITVDLSPTDSAQLRATINDVITTAPKSSVQRIAVQAGQGNDTIAINLPADLKIPVAISGGNGNDTITGSALNDYIAGNDGNDSINSASGNDTIYGSWGNDNLEGGPGADLLVGGSGGDLLVGNAGNDQLYGQTGDDSLAGGLGNDRIDAATGNDQLHGSAGSDWLSGGDGNDSLWGGEGRDSLIGGNGNDTVNYIKSEDRIQKSTAETQLTEQRINPLKRLDDPAQLKQWLIDQSIQQWKSSFGQPVYSWWWYRGGPIEYYAALDGTGAPPPNAKTNDYSTTNTQEQGVDEADLVKTDGNFLYILANNELVIMDAWPADTTHIVSRTPIEGYATGLYLQGDTVAVLSNTYTTADKRWFGPLADAASFCPIPWRSTSQTELTVLNITNREKPTPIVQTKLDGYSNQSRLVDGRLYLILDNPLDLPEPQRIEVKLDDPAKQSQWVYENEDTYRARLQAMPLDQLLPGYTTTTTNPDGSTTTTAGPIPRLPDFYVPADPTKRSWNMFSVSLFDLNNLTPDPIATTSVVGFSGQIYASTTSLYAAATTYEVPMGAWQGELRTDLYKFALNKAAVPLVATGQVAGHVHNQFSMDEEGDYFRVATTSSNADGTANNVFVLNQSENDLKLTGSIVGLAFSERIYSARFVGSRGYLVTFRQIDPLFTLDLSDPKHPTVAGELKIPGYSAYLHPFDYTDRDNQTHNLLIGLGRDATDQGRVQGVQLSLFDVTNIASPTRIATYTYPNTGTWNGNSWTAAEWDHHAFSYFPQQQILALPMVTYGMAGSSGLDVFKFNLEYTLDPDPAVKLLPPITLLGRVDHPTAPLRSVRIETFLYSIASDAVKVVVLDQPTQLLIEVPIPVP
jgi:uncharacterized secreted protein with C-terminal beta-propeller domain